MPKTPPPYPAPARGANRGGRNGVPAHGGPVNGGMVGAAGGRRPTYETALDEMQEGVTSSRREERGERHAPGGMGRRPRIR